MPFFAVRKFTPFQKSKQKHLKTSPKVKLEDGTEEDHKQIEAKDDAEIKNLIEWILAQ